MPSLNDLPTELLPILASHLPYTDARRLRLCSSRFARAVAPPSPPTHGDWIRLNGDRHYPALSLVLCPGCLEEPPRDMMKPPDWIPNFLARAGAYTAFRTRHAHRCSNSCTERFEVDGTLTHDGWRCGDVMQERPRVRWRPICQICVWKLRGLL